MRLRSTCIVDCGRHWQFRSADALVCILGGNVDYNEARNVVTLFHMLKSILIG